MNRAFVREPEEGEPRCPLPDGCGGIGLGVTRKTLRAQLPDSAVQGLVGSCYYCLTPSCPVAYFDRWGTTVPCTALRTPAYAKSPDAPVCACFGVTAEAIREAAQAGRKDFVRELIARAEGPDARCETKSPSGASCVTEIRRIFMKHFAAKQAPGTDVGTD